jgi:hypothetical protein
LMPPMENGQG